MQSSTSEIMNVESAVVVSDAPQDGQLGTALKELENLGFIRLKQNLRLLKKTNGNLDAVREFLLAKRKLHEAKMASKREHRKEGKEHKREAKLHKHEDKEERRSRKCEKKRELKIQFKTQRHCRRTGHRADVKKEEDENNIPRLLEDGEHHGNQGPIDPAVQAKTLPFLSVWPSQVTRLYLDGNNMLYIAAPVRAKAIHRQMSAAGIILSSVAYEFTKLLPAAVKTTMVFDACSHEVLQSYRADNFQILSARPVFGSSDDALVQWAKDNTSAHVLSMVVTSDRELQRRLAEVSGVVLVKPKAWMQYAASLLDRKPATDNGSNNNNSSADPAEEKEVNLDAWMTQWIQRMEEESLAGQLQNSLTVSKQ
jgi:rRNA-processing protein FCF1